MKCAAEMGSVAMIYIPSLINIGSGIQNLIGVDTQQVALTLVSCSAYFSTMKAICSSQTSVDSQRTKRLFVPEDGTLHWYVLLTAGGPIPN
jgi:hypothetical protein